MARLTIDLIDGFFIEQDELNNTLRQAKTIENNGEKKIVIETIGYFRNVSDCIERCIRLICLAENDERVICMKEYKEMAEKAFKRIHEGYIDEVLGRK